MQLTGKSNNFSAIPHLILPEGSLTGQRYRQKVTPSKASNTTVDHYSKKMKYCHVHICIVLLFFFTIIYSFDILSEVNDSKAVRYLNIHCKYMNR